MLMMDHEKNVFKTGNKLDYTPKMINFSEDLLAKGDAQMLGCGKRHYLILDKNHNIHCFGNVFKSKAIGNHAGFDVYDADQMFDGGKIHQWCMGYEIYGVLAEFD
jgi:hypothetical protein